MDTTLAFVVSFGMAVTGQVTQDVGNSEDEHMLRQTVEQSQQRAARIQKRIALTNQWTRQMRQGGLTQR